MITKGIVAAAGNNTQSKTEIWTIARAFQSGDNMTRSLQDNDAFIFSPFALMEGMAARRLSVAGGALFSSERHEGCSDKQERRNSQHDTCG